jgi:hypothetical protein
LFEIRSTWVYLLTHPLMTPLLPPDPLASAMPAVAVPAITTVATVAIFIGLLKKRDLIPISPLN